MIAKTIKYKVAHNSIRLGRKWGGAVSQAALGQGLFMILSFVAGLIIVRHLDKKDYGIYTILNSIQIMMLSLSNSNITTGFKTVGGKIWHDNYLMSSLINSADKLRKQLAWIIIPPVILYGGYLLYEQNNNISSLFILYLILIVTGIIPELKRVFIAEAFLLKSDIKTHQVTQNLQQGIKLALISLLLLFSTDQFPLLCILAINIIASWIACGYIRRKSNGFYDARIPSQDQYYQELTYYPKKTWHNTLFFVFQHQIYILILSIFGSVESIAELGALGRFSIITSFFIAIFSNVFVPAFAKYQGYNKIFKIYLQFLILACIISAVIIIMTLLNPSIFLYVLGNNYSELKEELILAMTGAVISFIMAILNQLNSARGWIDILSKFSISTYFVTILISICFLDLSTLKGVLLLNIFIEVSKTILQMINGWYGYLKYKRNALQNT